MQSCQELSQNLSPILREKDESDIAISETTMKLQGDVRGGTTWTGWLQMRNWINVHKNADTEIKDAEKNYRDYQKILRTLTSPPVGSNQGKSSKEEKKQESYDSGYEAIPPPKNPPG
ncbi:hypothetical protein Tco_1385522 [Tanacetum coccineum]